MKWARSIFLNQQSLSFLIRQIKSLWWQMQKPHYLFAWKIVFLIMKVCVCVCLCVWESVWVSECVCVWGRVACTECTCQRQTTACAVTRTVFFQRCFKEVVTVGLFRGGTQIRKAGESLVYSPPPGVASALWSDARRQTSVFLLSFGVLSWRRRIHIVYGFPLSKGKQK